MRTSQEDATQRRATLACVACRAARHKCDGGQAPSTSKTLSSAQTTSSDLGSGSNTSSRGRKRAADAEFACSRCQRLGLTCSWVPSQRMGRPRKSKDESDSHGTEIEIEKTSALHGSDSLLSRRLPAIQDSQMLLANPSWTLQSEAQHDPLSIADIDTLGEADDEFWEQLILWGQESLSTPIELSSLPYGHAPRDEVIMTRSPIAPAERNEEPSLVGGIRNYRRLAAYPLPFGTDWDQLCDPTQVYQISSTKASGSEEIWPDSYRCLALSMAATGSRLSWKKEASCDIQYRRAYDILVLEAPSLTNKLQRNLEGKTRRNVVTEALDLLFSGAILARYAYGVVELEEALTILGHCATLAKALGLNAMDADGNGSVQQSAHIGTELVGDNSQTPLSSIFAQITVASCEQDGNCCRKIAGSTWTQSCLACLKNAFREAWWELFSCNAVIFAATLHGGPLTNSILGLGSIVLPPQSHQQTPTVQRLWRLRVRAAAILAECVKPTVYRLSDADADARLTALDRMAESATASLESLFEDLKNRKDEEFTLPLGRERALQMVALSLTQVYGAQMDLHQLYWLPVDEEEKSKTATKIAIQARGGNKQQTRQALSSLQIINRCSDAIINLICELDGSRLVGDDKDAEEGVLLIRGRCAFFACVQVAAALGKAMALSAHLQDKSTCSFGAAAHSDSQALISKSSVLRLCTCAHGASQRGRLLLPLAERGASPIDTSASDKRGLDLNKKRTAGTYDLSDWTHLAGLQMLQKAQDSVEDVRAVWPFIRQCHAEISSKRQSLPMPARADMTSLMFALQST